jgi:NADH-quinone oxidoreductase subunit N
MNVGAFAVVSHVAAGGERYVSVDDYSGLGRRSPLLAFTLTIFMLSLIGIPATAGFLAKYYVFNAALSASAHPSALVWLTIIGLVNSAVASYYYLRLIVVMYMREPLVVEAPAPASAAMKLALVLAAIATIYLGVMPGRITDLSLAGAKDLTRIAVTAGGEVSPATIPVAATPAK